MLLLWWMGTVKKNMRRLKKEQCAKLQSSIFPHLNEVSLLYFALSCLCGSSCSAYSDC